MFMTGNTVYDRHYFHARSFVAFFHCPGQIIFSAEILHLNGSILERKVLSDQNMINTIL